MTPVEEALDGLSAGIGTRLIPDSDGFIKLRLADAIDVFVEVVSENELEVSVRLTKGSEPPDPTLLEGALRANANLHAPRFALEGGSDAILLGDRIDVLVETPQSLHERLSFIARTATGLVMGGFGPIRALVPESSSDWAASSHGMVTIWP
jgi:hypothetical protein